MLLSIDAIVHHVVNNGTLNDWCTIHNIPYSDAHNFIFDDPNNKIKYNDALNNQRDMMKDKMIKLLNTLTSANRMSIYDDSGDLRPISEWDDDVRKSVKKIRSEETAKGTIIINVEFEDLTRSIEMLGKYIGMLSDKLDITSKVDYAELVKQSYSTINN
jgi:ABC-type antimicrobial peptide transport system ATPase subunit